jgi:IMP dehydrogenase
MCKALAMGANSIMVGRLVAGCEESPGIAFNKDGRFVKMYRGMAGRNSYNILVGANISKVDKTGGNLNPQTFSAEGVEGYIPFTGPLKFVLQGYASGIRSGMSYTGAHDLKELREKAKFIQITNSGFKESNVHGISKFD